jgi:hypothetical protein
MRVWIKLAALYAVGWWLGRAWGRNAYWKETSK